MRKFILLLVVIMVLGSISCRKPYQKEVIREIKANETAFLIPLEGSSKKGQAKFNSIEFLEEAKVGAKRITMPTRWLKTGRYNSMGKWIETMLLIKVNRSPVSREWTDSSDTGTEAKKQAIWVESKDSIEFSVGVVCTGMVTEEDTARFLYYYTGKSLNGHVMDKNVRASAVKFLTSEFSKYDLADGRSKKTEISEALSTYINKEYKSYGLTITTIGFSGGLVYRDKAIQTAINKKFVAEMEKDAQAEINTKNISMAEAEKQAALRFAAAADARKKQVGIEIALMNAQARLNWSKAWNGQLPSKILPEGSSLLMSIE
jgi:hypothetical protein